MSNQIFKKDEVIVHKNKFFRAIVVDHELAVFAPISIKQDGGTRTSMDRGLFTVSNIHDTAPFRFERYGKIENAKFVPILEPADHEHNYVKW